MTRGGFGAGLLAGATVTALAVCLLVYILGRRGL